MILQLARLKRHQTGSKSWDIYEDLEAIQKRNVTFDTWRQGWIFPKAPLFFFGVKSVDGVSGEQKQMFDTLW